MATTPKILLLVAVLIPSASPFTVDLIQNFNKCSAEMRETNVTSANCDTSFETADKMEKSSWLENLKYFQESIPYLVVVSTAYVAVLLIGTAGNFLVISVIVLKSHMRTISNLFILNLAVADALILLFCLPATHLAKFFTSWTVRSFLCKVVTYVQGTSVVASSYFLVAVSADRCKAIHQLSVSTTGFTKRQATLLVYLIWLYSLFLISPWIYVFEIHTFGNKEYCYENWTSENLSMSYFYFVTLFQGYIIPVLLITMANYIIWRKVSDCRLPQSANSSSISTIHPIRNAPRKTCEGVEKMLITVTFTYILSWLPLYTLVTVKRLQFSYDVDTILNVLMPFAQFLAYSNSCVNPVLYGFFNANYRNMLKSLFPKWVNSPCCFRRRVVGEA